MSDVSVKLAVQGDGVVVYNVAKGTTVEELKAIANLNPHLEIRIGGESVADDYEIDDDTLVIGAKPVKGGR